MNFQYRNERSPVEKTSHKKTRNSMSVALSIVALVAAATLVEGVLTLAPESAQAVVGRPLTPMSYAGVARRTTRRAAYVGASTAYAGAAYAGAAVVGATIATLPAGCTTLTSAGYTYHHCGSIYYSPVYDGPNVTYVQVEHP